ncbi:MAG: right-handed parallel beta-helix repeat-containing protein, partial [Opitutaceae bacterium]|nr:right-handed parallel beta-helix repeat-containing protein [Opitutaceae bacterium]
MKFARNASAFFLAASVCLAVCAQNPTARVVYIGPDGDDSASGTQEQPRRSIQKAMDAAQPGDTVRLLPGIYRERLTLTKGGEYAAPITLEGMDGAIIEGSEEAALTWTPAPDVAPGVYRTPLAFLPRCAVVDGKQMVLMDASRFANAAAISKLFKNGFERGGWKYIKGAGLYLPEKKELIVRFDRDADPSKMQFILAPDAAVVRIDGANRIVLRNLELRHAHHGVMILNSVGSVVENCYINRTRDGITLTFGADSCTIRFNRITQTPLGANNGTTVISGAKQVRDDKWSQAWDLWKAHKTHGYYDCKGINMDRSTGGHRIHDNHIHDHWDSIATRGWDKWETDAADRMAFIQYNRGVDVHHNLIERANDEGLELNDGGIDQKWHHNVIINVRCGTRFKPIDKGPLYFYGNIFKDNGEDIRFYGERELNPSVVYIYNNSSNAAQAIMSNKVRGIGTPGFHVYNNLFWIERWWGKTGDGVVEPNWKADYNVFIRRGVSSSWNDMR